MSEEKLTRHQEEMWDILKRKTETNRINWLEANRGFDHWLDIYDGFLPNPRSRWCTKKLKIEPLEKFVGDDEAFSYIAIRADEDRFLS